MLERIESISAIWVEKHKVGLEECSKRIELFLQLLKKHNPLLFESWYEKGGIVKRATENKVDVNQNYFLNELQKIKRRYDDVGITVSYWTGRTMDVLSASISFTIGGYGEKSFNRNSCVLNLPIGSAFYDQQQHRESLYKLIVDYWHPNEILINGETFN